VDAAQAGSEVACPACGGRLVVPQLDDQSGELPSDISSLDMAEIELILPAAASSKPRSAKAKLWQKPTGSMAADGELPPAAPELPKPLSPAIFAPSPAAADGQVVDLSTVSEDDTPALPYTGRAEAIARQAQQQRRLVSNAVMLAGSIAILIGALAALMYLAR